MLQNNNLKICRRLVWRDIKFHKGRSIFLVTAVALGGLLALGIGDTMRVSLSADPVEEVYAAREILKAAGVRQTVMLTGDAQGAAQSDKGKPYKKNGRPKNYNAYGGGKCPNENKDDHRKAV